MALLLQALLPSRKVPLRALLPGSILIGIALTTLNLAVSKSILSLGTRFQAYGFIGGFLVPVSYTHLTLPTNREV